MTEQLTLLQRGVLHRLREHPQHDELAKLLTSTWSAGTAVKPEPLASLSKGLTAELADDIQRANRHAPL